MATAAIKGSEFPEEEGRLFLSLCPNLMEVLLLVLEAILFLCLYPREVTILVIHLVHQ
jgi:hypothetical protein